jgi:hypothetical protein
MKIPTHLPRVDETCAFSSMRGEKERGPGAIRSLSFSLMSMSKLHLSLAPGVIQSDFSRAEGRQAAKFCSFKGTHREPQGNRRERGRSHQLLLSGFRWLWRGLIGHPARLLPPFTGHFGGPNQVLPPSMRSHLVQILHIFCICHLRLAILYLV